ncbi:MAG: Holliday junction resolvase RuvX [Candidatus Aminicenantaceae bacterium]
MRILGIDFGDKSIGLAVSDPLFLIAQSLGRYRLQSKEKNKIYFTKLISEYDIGKIVIGFPLRMNGTEGTRTEKTRKFGCWLKNISGLPVVFWDERLTTKQASRLISQQNLKRKNKKNLDHQVSAAIILSAYLESIRNHTNDH